GLTAKVLDFGIAKLADTEGEHLTRTGEIFGTPAYMSPEQCEGASDVDFRADIYSLGIILFEMISGRTPFYEPTDKVGVVMMKQMSAPPPPPSRMVVGRAVPPEVDQLLLRILSKSPGERPSPCARLPEELRQAVGPLASDSGSQVSGAQPLFGLA